MLYRRVLYALVLAGVLLFQITNENYLAHFLLGLCIALPLLSIVMSLPGMLRCRVELSARPAEVDRGERGSWSVGVDTFAGLPLAQVTMGLTVENLLTGKRESRRLKLVGVARRRPVELPVPTGRCGLVELRARRVRVCDYLGLVTLPVAPPHPARLLCRPIPAECRPVEVPPGQGASSPRSAVRRGPGEDYELREYRPGDPMRAVHWKLSSKWDELIVRERGNACEPLPLLAIDRFGAIDEIDALMDQLAGMSRALLNAQRPHAVLWLEADGEPRMYPVGDEREYAACLLALLSGPAPRKGPRLKDFPELFQGLDGPVYPIHITAEGVDGHG